jgi:hypothetical protein
MDSDVDSVVDRLGPRAAERLGLAWLGMTVAEPPEPKRHRCSTCFNPYGVERKDCPNAKGNR